MDKTFNQTQDEIVFINQLNNVSSSLSDWAIAQLKLGFSVENIKMRLRDAANLSGRN